MPPPSEDIAAHRRFVRRQPRFADNPATGVWPLDVQSESFRAAVTETFVLVPLRRGSCLAPDGLAGGSTAGRYLASVGTCAFTFTVGCPVSPLPTHRALRRRHPGQILGVATSSACQRQQRLCRGHRRAGIGDDRRQSPFPPRRGGPRGVPMLQYLSHADKKRSEGSRTLAVDCQSRRWVGRWKRICLPGRLCLGPLTRACARLWLFRLLRPPSRLA